MPGAKFLEEFKKLHSLLLKNIDIYRFVVNSSVRHCSYKEVQLRIGVYNKTNNEGEY